MIGFDSREVTQKRAGVVLLCQKQRRPLVAAQPLSLTLAPGSVVSFLFSSPSLFSPGLPYSIMPLHGEFCRAAQAKTPVTAPARTTTKNKQTKKKKTKIVTSDEMTESVLRKRKQPPPGCGVSRNSLQGTVFWETSRSFLDFTALFSRNKGLSKRKEN